VHTSLKRFFSYLVLDKPATLFFRLWVRDNLQKIFSPFSSMSLNFSIKTCCYTSLRSTVTYGKWACKKDTAFFHVLPHRVKISNWFSCQVFTSTKTTSSSKLPTRVVLIGIGCVLCPEVSFAYRLNEQRDT